MRMARYDLGCDVDDGIDALEYWRGRRDRLPWRRRAARREAEQMIANWERRLGRAVLRDPSLTPAERLDAGLLVVRSRGAIALRRWRRRAAMAMAATAGLGAAALAALLTIL